MKQSSFCSRCCAILGVHFCCLSSSRRTVLDLYNVDIKSFTSVKRKLHFGGTAGITGSLSTFQPCIIISRQCILI